MTDPHASYELFEELGRGEYTVVYRAHDLALGRDVAIKQLSEAALTDPRRRERFLKEAQFLAQHEHANILRIHSVEPQRGWIVMELMRGTLEGAIATQAMPPATVRSILRQLLPALDFLHSKNRIHGAIRPSNVLIDDAGTVKLSDFEESNLTGELRAPEGAKKYLAPEMLDAQFGKLGPAADIYCLGFAALELLAGPTFSQLFPHAASIEINSDIAWLRWHSSRDPLPPVKTLLPHVPQDLAEALDCMLSKLVDEREQSATSVLQRLSEQVLVPVQPVEPPKADSTAGRGIVPTNIQELEPLNRLARASIAVQPLTAADDRGRQSAGGKQAAASSSRERINATLEKPWVLYSLCAAILLLALAVGWKLRQDNDFPEPIANGRDLPTERLALPGEDGSEPEEAASALAESAETDVEPVPAETFAVERSEQNPGNLPQTPLPPDAIPSPVDPFEGTPGHPVPLPVELLVVRPERGTPPRPESPPEMVVAKVPTITSPLLSLVSVVVDPTDVLAELTGPAELVIDSGGFISEISDMDISPNGELLAVSGEKVVRIWELTSGTLLATLRGDRTRTSYGDCYAVTFSPDGKNLVVGVNDYEAHGSIRVYDLANLDEIAELLPGHTTPTRKLDFSTDGKYMLSADADGHIALWDWEQRKILRRVAPRNADQPIYDELQFAGDAPVIIGVDFKGPVVYSVPELRPMSGQDPLPSHLHGWIVDLLSRQLEYPFASTDDPRTFELDFVSQRWAASGFATVEGENRFWVGVWQSHGLQESGEMAPLSVYRGHRWNVDALTIAPEHGIVASGDKYGEVHVWKIDDGERLHLFKGQGKPVYEAALDRNSKRIVFGTRSFAPDRWGWNSYGTGDQILDLAARAIYPAAAAENLAPIQEVPVRDTIKLQATVPDKGANAAVEKIVQGQVAGRYTFTSGRLPTIFSIMPEPVMSVREPVLLGDSLGLLGLWDSDTDELRRAFIGHEGQITAVSLAPNGKSILSGSTDRTIRMWSLENPMPTGIFDFKFENSAVTQVRPGTSSAEAGVQAGDKILSIDGLSIAKMYNLMLEGKFDYRPGQAIPLRMERAGEPYEYSMTMVEGYDFSEPILSFYVGDDGKWIAWTPQGYYDASPGADQMIGWHVNRGPAKSAQFFEIQQFRKQLYRPDIIDAILGGASLEEAIEQSNSKLAMQDDFDFRSPSDIAMHYPPTIEFTSPKRGDQVSQDGVNIRAEITSRNGLPIREVTLLINGVAAEVFTPATPTEIAMSIDYKAQLVAGRNDIELIAANAESTSGAKSIFVHMTVPTPKPTRPSNLNLLAIGLSAYRNSSPDLNAFAATTAAQDAQAFGQTVQNQSSGLLYSNVTTRVLTDQAATQTGILEGFQWLIDQTEPGDTAMVYLATTGFVDATGNFYLGTYEAELQRPRATAVSWREFIQTMHEDLPQSKRVVFLDIQPTEQAIASGIKNPLLDLAAPELATVFFSSNSLQQATLPQPTTGRGYLSQALSATLANSDADVFPTPPDSLLSSDELSRSWSAAMEQLSQGQLYPVAYAPESSKRVNLLQIVR
ncbi:protein kinase domain-containing protein [Aureliella helgolandensis]|uniref:Serine/threonine-protein kinase PrkC n=1 Tax=Aureliella helgolandensis TaxID=2527968 RepID=A0A518G149_9BACT|nr:protein kinase [Aureliella helgolandensis]QDV22331.1 Serine/threonine-protein kinase PrkC [Aureliella helgolandensis]